MSVFGRERALLTKAGLVGEVGGGDVVVALVLRRRSLSYHVWRRSSGRNLTDFLFASAPTPISSDWASKSLPIRLSLEELLNEVRTRSTSESDSTLDLRRRLPASLVDGDE